MLFKTQSRPLRRGTAALLLVMLLAGCGPFLPTPSGALDGEPTPPPADWTFSDDTWTAQLETQPDAPYSVNVWAVGVGPALYIHAGPNRTAWVEHIESDPAVRLRIGTAIYELTAVRVDDQAEFDRFSAAYEDKYWVRPGNSNVGEVWLFRLEPR